MQRNGELETEVEFLRQSLTERDQREDELFQHSKQLCELLEAQREALAEKDKQIQ